MLAGKAVEQVQSCLCCLQLCQEIFSTAWSSSGNQVLADTCLKQSLRKSFKPKAKHSTAQLSTAQHGTAQHSTSAADLAEAVDANGAH